MTARSTYEAVAAIGGTANLAKLASDQSAEATYNSTAATALGVYNAAGPSGFAAYDLSVKNAQKTLVASKQKNAHDHQQTIQAAKDVLRSTGDLAPA